MDNTCSFLDAVKSRRGLPSDYALAKELGITRAAVSKLRIRHDCMSDSTALRVASLLEIDPGIVLAAVHRERAKKDDEKAAWTAILRKLGGIAASAFIGLSALSAPPPSYASSNIPLFCFSLSHNMDYAKYGSMIRRALSRLLFILRKPARKSLYKPRMIFGLFHQRALSFQF